MPHIFVAWRLVAESFCGMYARLTSALLDAWHFRVLKHILFTSQKSASTLVALLFFLIAPFVSYAEYIDSFDAHIKLNTDSSFVVTETITYVFDTEKHGIFRYIPTKHPQKPDAWYRERYMEIGLESVTMDGDTVPFDIKKESGRIFVKIGDPDSTITGTHTYVITYTVTGGLSYAPVTELYWNVTGDDWPVLMKNVTATLSSDEGLFANERACYQGTKDAFGSCNRVTREGNVVTFHGVQVLPGEGITIAQSINPARVEKVINERNKIVFLWIIGVALWFGGLVWFVYDYKTQYKTGNTIIAQYEPYPEVKPMYAGLLMDGKLDPRDITACIVYLAEQGYLKIKKTEKKVLFFFEVDDYEITLLKLPDTVSLFEKNILALLLREPQVVGKTVALSDLKTDISKQRENQKLLGELKKDLEADLETSGFFQVTIPTQYIITGGIVTITIALFLVGSSPAVFAIIGTLFIIAFMYRRRTKKGYEALDHLKGFKEFLSVTDKERFDFHNAPEKSPEQFMQYLPYAIAFGVEEKWAEVFKDINIPNPNWYDGGTAGSFSAVNLSSSIGAFSTAFAASSGSSGSSGGGSVGGGGGGGGGGSW